MSDFFFFSGIENSYHAKFYCKFAKTRKMTWQSQGTSRCSNAKLQRHAKVAQAKWCTDSQQWWPFTSEFARSRDFNLIGMFCQSYDELNEARTRIAATKTKPAGRPGRGKCNWTRTWMPETHESASATTALCLSKPQETEIDSAHRIPARNGTPDPKPVISKFTRIAKGQVIQRPKYRIARWDTLKCD